MFLECSNYRTSEQYRMVLVYRVGVCLVGLSANSLYISVSYNAVVRVHFVGSRFSLLLCCYSRSSVVSS